MIASWHAKEKQEAANNETELDLNVSDDKSNNGSYFGNKVGIILPESMINDNSEIQSVSKKIKNKKKMKNYLKKLETEKREMEI